MIVSGKRVQVKTGGALGAKQSVTMSWLVELAAWPSTCNNYLHLVFMSRFGIASESYHYTSLAERRKTDAFVAAGGAALRSKAHSSDFHLKMRVATAMIKDLLPVFTLFDLQKVVQQLNALCCCKKYCSCAFGI